MIPADLDGLDGLEVLAFEAALTEREAEAFALQSRGCDAEEIARELDVSEHTARCYLSRAHVKVRRFKAEAMAEADQWGDDADAAVEELRERTEKR